MLVREAMTRRAEAIGPEESLVAAARRMRETGVGVLAVCEGNRAVGILTDRDIVVRAIASGRAPSATPVRSAMTSQIVSCRDDEDLAAAAGRMQAGTVRRLLVVDASERPLGLLSVDDVALHSHALAGEILERARAPERPVHRGPWSWWEEPAT